jgi:hypothetical protein
VIPDDRMARVRFFNEGHLLAEVKEISLYDLNSHPILQYSLGDHVMIRNKLEPSLTQGIVEGVVTLATELVGGMFQRVTDSHPPSLSNGINVDWVGEIFKINTDGTVVVRLARELETTKDWIGERFDTVKGEDLVVFEPDDDDGEGDWDYEDDVSHWSDEDSDEEWEDAMDDDIPEASLDGMDDIDESPTDATPVSVNGNNESMPVDVPVDVPQVNLNSILSDAIGLNKEKCAGFDILAEVPNDHPFRSDPPSTQTDRAFLSRIRNEHQILQSSLPGALSISSTNFQRAF